MQNYLFSRQLQNTHWVGGLSAAADSGYFPPDITCTCIAVATAFILGERCRCQSVVAIRYTDSMASQVIFERYRPLLFSIAYKMVGSIALSQQILAETLARWIPVDDDLIGQPRLYLVKAVTQRSMHALREAEIARDLYPGIWLPEPLAEPGPVGRTHRSEYEWFIGFLRLLDLLGIRGRAVYLLRESLDFSYEEIAKIMGRSEADCRLQMERSSEIMTAGRSYVAFDPARQKHLVEAFRRAHRSRQCGRLVECLDESVALYPDVGGVVAAAQQPVYGREAVWKSLQRLYQQAEAAGNLSFAEVNGCPALMVRDAEAGQAETVMVFEATARKVDAVYVMRNPEKLKHLRSMCA
jgi:RNA polymerase sigma-70 factor, ECF subfamily